MATHRITLIGDAAHLMTPFAGVGVNVAMEDALHLARNIIASKTSWVTEHRSGLAAALQKYEAEMFVRAEDYAKQTWMYLGLFFHERGGIAMVENFERTRAQEAAAATAAATAAAAAAVVEGQEPASQTETVAEEKAKVDQSVSVEETPQSQKSKVDSSETEFGIHVPVQVAEIVPSAE